MLVRVEEVTACHNAKKASDQYTVSPFLFLELMEDSMPFNGENSIVNAV